MNYKWIGDSRLNPQTDFELHEQTLIEDVVALTIKLAAYGELRARTQANLTRLEDNLKSLSARISLEARKANHASGVKLTEDALKAVILTHPDYEAMLPEVHEAQEQDFYAEAWWKTIIKVSDLAQMMGYGRNAEIRRA